MVQVLAAALGEQVTAMPQYSQYQPKAYRPRMSAFWYLDRWPYLLFILREVSSFFVAYFAVVIVVQICALSSGPAAYAQFQAWMRNPLMIVLNAVTLAFVLLHAVTWFNLVPRVMMRQVLGKQLPDAMVSAPNYFVLLGASAIIGLFILRIL
jgi:succinate dehydrogenase subunit C